MDDKQLLEEKFLSYDYTKPEEYEKRYNKSCSLVSSGNGGGNRNKKRVCCRICLYPSDYHTEHILFLYVIGRKKLDR